MPALLHESLPSYPAFDFDFDFDFDNCLPLPPSLPDAVTFAPDHCPNFKFLPSNYDSFLNATSPATAHFACDDFRMYEFKVRRCMKGRSHDWTECPFAHPGEKARRRDPRRIHYSGAPCPDFRKGSCRRGDACEFAHGVFECWLHPARYRTQACKDGKNCKRRVCFFAHSPEQLRVLPVSTACAPTSAHAFNERADGSPVGSPRRQFYSMKDSVASFPPHEGFMPSSVGVSRAHSFNSSSVMVSSMPKIQSAIQAGNVVGTQMDVSSGFALRRAMLQNMLAFKGYGSELNAAEFSVVPDSPEVHMESRVLPQSQFSLHSHANMGVCRKLSLPVEMKGYDFTGQSHGFASPTSTLEPHVFSPPPLSPPLSPSTSPHGDDTKITYTNLANANGSPNALLERTVTFKNSVAQTYMYNNFSDVEGLGFYLQSLQVTNNSAGGLSSESHHASMQGRMPNLARQLHTSSNLARASSKQVMCETSCELADEECDKLRDCQGYEVDVGAIGEESTNLDNLVPDFGWVSELVK